MAFEGGKGAWAIFIVAIVFSVLVLGEHKCSCSFKVDSHDSKENGDGPAQ